MKDKLFDGLLDYKEPKEKKISIKAPKISGGSMKTRKFPKSGAKKFTATKVKTPHYSKLTITDAPKHESGWM